MWLWRIKCYGVAAGIALLLLPLVFFCAGRFHQPVVQGAAPSPPPQKLPQRVFGILPDSERIWHIPLPAGDAVPESIVSDRAVVRLRYRADGGLELLYWGNPVRKQYAWRLRSGGKSALMDSEGDTQAYRQLPVTAPAREDKQLPLQPVLRVDGVRGLRGCPYAASLEVFDPATGQVFCRRNCLIEGDQAAK